MRVIACAMRAACAALAITLAGGHRLRTNDSNAVVLGNGIELELGHEDLAKGIAAHPSRVTVRIRQDDWCAKNGSLQQKVCEHGQLKPKIPQLQMTISQISKGLKHNNGKWFHETPLNLWPGLGNAQLESIHCQNEGGVVLGSEWERFESTLWTPSSRKTPFEGLRSKCRNLLSIWGLPKWTERGFAESAPGFFYWFSPTFRKGSQILLGTNALQADSNLLRPQLKRATLLGHEFFVGLHHAIVLLEWEEPNQPVTVVEVNRRYYGAIWKTNYYEDGLSEQGRYVAALGAKGIEGMNRPVLDDWAEIRMLDLDMYSLAEFLNFVSRHSPGGSGDTRFNGGTTIIATEKARRVQRTRADIIALLLKYLHVDNSYDVLLQNCQNFAIELFAEITVTRPKAAFLSGMFYAVENLLDGVVDNLFDGIAAIKRLLES